MIDKRPVCAVQPQDLPGGSAWGWKIVGALSALLALAVATAWVESSYFGINVPGSISFPGNDGWCHQSTQGFGLHCWGDYGAIQFHSLSDPPRGPEMVYPVSTRIARIPFWIIGSLAGYRAGLALFIVTSTLSMLAPALWAVKELPLRLKPLFISLACVATAPFLVILDRGNILALAAPALLVYLIGLVKYRPWLVTMAVVVAASVKPQFAILGLALVALRCWVPALVAIMGSIAVTILPFFIFFQSQGAIRLQVWMTDSIAWSSSQSLAVDWPTNISLPRVVSLFSHGLTKIGSRTGIELPTFEDGTSVKLFMGMAIAVVVVLLLRGRRLHPFLLGTVFLVLACLASPISYAYYGFFLIPLLAVIFRSGPRVWPTNGHLNIVITSLMSLGIVLGLSPLLIPMSVVAASPGTSTIVASLFPVLASIMWGLLLLTSAVKALWPGNSNYPAEETDTRRLTDGG